jgi:putative hydrolase of the HAD superfamily
MTTRTSASPAVIDAVTFDFWQTLMSEVPGHLNGERRAAWERILADVGLAVTAEALREAFARSWATYEARWIAGVQYLAVDAAADIMAMLGIDPRTGTGRALTRAMVETGRNADLLPAPGIHGCLDRLRAAGVRIGIVCDVGMTGSEILLSHLERHGLLAAFDHWSFSDVVGRYKPAPEIFRHALAGLGGVDPARAAHVGDRLRTDVAGALDMGMVAVRYTGLYDDPAEGFAEATHVLSAHADLPAALGIGAGRPPDVLARRDGSDA